MATPAAFTSPYTDALISTFDFHMPEKDKILFRKYGDQGMGFYSIMDTLGFIKPVEQTGYSHFEEDFIHVPVHVLNNVGSPGVGNSISFTLPPSDLNSLNEFYVKVQDDVMFSNQVTGKVTGISVAVPTAPVVTVQPSQATDNIGALTAGDTVIIYSNSFAEGTDQPLSSVADSLEYFWNTKIVKESSAYTGSEATNKTWFDVTSDGQSIPSYYMKGTLDADYRMALRMNGAMLFDRTTTNTTLLATGERTTQGLVPWVRSGGNNDLYNIGFYAMADFDIMNIQLDANFAPQEEMAMLGIQLQTEWDNLFANSFVNGAIVYGMFKEGQKAIDLSLGFNTFSKTERIWHIKRMAGFSNPQTYGAPGFKIPNMGVVCPMDGKKDAKSNNVLPSFGQRYKALGNYNRKMKVWPTGGAKFTTNTIDADQINIRSEFGSQFVASNRFFLIEAN